MLSIRRVLTAAVFVGFTLKAIQLLHDYLELRDPASSARRNNRLLLYAVKADNQFAHAAVATIG